MTDSKDIFTRIVGRVNVPHLSRCRVVIVGAGTVGSQLARELALCGVGDLLLIDGDVLEATNLVRHALPSEFVGQNKAEALTVFLARTVPTLHVRGLAVHAGGGVSDDELDLIFDEADLVVVATDNRDAQRRVARRSLALDIPAVLPGLYEDGGGEVFVQLNAAAPCFMCWDGFRPADVTVRSATAINADTLSVIQLAVFASLAVLDPACAHARLLAPTVAHGRLRQLQIQRPLAAVRIAAVSRRPNCPSCGVGPAPLRAAQPAGARENTSDLVASIATPESPAGQALELALSHAWIVFGVVLMLAVIASVAIWLLWVVVIVSAAAAAVVNA